MDDDQLLVAYLEDFDGDVWAYKQLMKKGVQRPGQAFFNCLDRRDRYRILGTSLDTFYMDDIEQIEKTIEFLLGY